MAEIEEIGELMEEVFGSLEEGAEGEEALEEEREAKAEAIDEAKSETSAFQKCLDFLKRFRVPPEVKAFIKAIAENALAGVVMNAVNLALHKLIAKARGLEWKTLQIKKTKVKAKAQLTSDLSKILKKLAVWTEEKDDDVVDVGEGLLVITLPDLVLKFTEQMEKVSAFLKINFWISVNTFCGTE